MLDPESSRILVRSAIQSEQDICLNILMQEIGLPYHIVLFVQMPCRLAAVIGFEVFALKWVAKWLAKESEALPTLTRQRTSLK